MAHEARLTETSGHGDLSQQRKVFQKECGNGGNDADSQLFNSRELNFSRNLNIYQYISISLYYYNRIPFSRLPFDNFNHKVLVLRQTTKNSKAHLNEQKTQKSKQKLLCAFFMFQKQSFVFAQAVRIQQEYWTANNKICYRIMSLQDRLPPQLPASTSLCLADHEEELAQASIRCMTQQALPSSTRPTQHLLPGSKNDIINQYKNSLLPFSNLVDSLSLPQIPAEVLQKHGIKILDCQQDTIWKKLIEDGHSLVELSGSRYGGLECEFQVVISRFLLTVTVLNMHKKSQEFSNVEYIGEGTFGVVKRLKVKDKQIAIKKINFSYKKPTALAAMGIVSNDDHSCSYQIRKAISEYCMYKICSMLRIGPQIIFENGYDLVCYNDCIQFKMQLCEPLSGHVNYQTYENNLKRSVAVLHALRLVHKDIKKQNTLYSPSFKSYILTDFGLTHSVKEQIWQETETYFAGSPTHACPEMKQLLYENKLGFVNLFMNDIHCMKATLAQVQAMDGLQGVDYDRNSMSMGQNSGEYCSEGTWGNSSLLREEQTPVNTENGYETETFGTSQSLRVIPTASTCNSEANVSNDLINYLQVKTLHRFLRNAGRKVEQLDEGHLGCLFDKFVDEQKQFQHLKAQILSSTLPIMNSISGKLLKLTHIRNLARIQGPNSLQFTNKLKLLAQSEAIQGLDYHKLKSYLLISGDSPYNRIYIKKFKNYLTSMERNVCLRNKKSLVGSLKALINAYQTHTQGPKNHDDRIQILALGIEVLNFEGLDETQYFQIVSLVHLILANKPIKKHEINAKSMTQMAQQIEKQLADKSRLSTHTLHNLIKLHLRNHSLQNATDLYHRLCNSRQQLQQQLLNTQNIPNTGLNEVKSDIIKHWLCQISYLLLTDQSQSGLEHALQCYEFQTQFSVTNNPLKLNLLDNIVSALTRLKRYDQAQIYSQNLLALTTSEFFPKLNCLQMALCHSYGGIIELARGNTSEALRKFQLVFECVSDDLRGAGHVRLIKQALVNMGVCYERLGELARALGVMEEAGDIALRYLYYVPEEPVQILSQILILLLRMGQIDEKFAFYCNQIARLKGAILDSPRLGLSSQHHKSIEFFDLQVLSKHTPSIQALVSARKHLLAAVEPHLPKYQIWYITQCQLQALYYIHSARATNKGLAYYWKIFNNIDKAQRTELIYQKMGVYVDMLAKSNSARRALKFLRQYVRDIPEQYQSLRMQAYRRLSELAEELGASDRDYYGFVCRNRVVKNHQNLEASMRAVDQEVESQIIGRIWKKKLRTIRIQKQAEDSNCAVALRNATNQVDLNQRNQEVQDKIKRKLIAARHRQISITA